MDFLYNITVDPVLQIVEDPVFFIQVLAEGLMAGVMYSLVALGFCLIYKASGVFNFAQGIFIVFSVLCLIFIFEYGVPIIPAVVIAFGVMVLLAYLIERLMLRNLVNQPEIIMFMATIG